MFRAPRNALSTLYYTSVKRKAEGSGFEAPTLYPPNYIPIGRGLSYRGPQVWLGCLSCYPNLAEPPASIHTNRGSLPAPNSIGQVKRP